MNDDGDDDQIQDDDTLADSNLLASFEFGFAKELRQPTRQLLVKDVMLCFDPASIYGKRTAFHKALMVTEPWYNCGKMALLASWLAGSGLNSPTTGTTIGSQLAGSHVIKRKTITSSFDCQLAGSKTKFKTKSENGSQLAGHHKLCYQTFCSTAVWQSWVP